jgi:hypothetical protein
MSQTAYRDFTGTGDRPLIAVAVGAALSAIFAIVRAAFR